ncbi:RNA polymerase III subunit [Heterostelium album PN500]|uniref:DNA-directed RNA polymerase subunit n=1 Tax=Heterostelium pallidum (strain ATCC 26659 / Pp 5 / PN500) TaxID=670386 RepID=D3BBD7_HETP5|nr:RNA polymerase III subunit [Heterostelium album PN500]EFA81344.1 RNA polymerase III subunit [Heterostelium album PN500]|eukprot:XP_020433462.1 RNA polymerase III subunit [Heterostelium album PN500]
MLFCPSCANMLLVEKGEPNTRFYCPTCPYIFNIQNKVVTKVPLIRKNIEVDVFGGDDAWLDSQQTDAHCPTCKERRRVYLMEIQVYPIDEPKTTYYKCTICGGRWKHQ